MCKSNQNARRPVGFRQQHQNQLTHVPRTESGSCDIPTFKNAYWEAIQKITREFIEAEAKGHGNSFLQFKKKYEAACALYRDEKKDLPGQISEFKHRLLDIEP
jgi:hypothetical protein